MATDVADDPDSKGLQSKEVGHSCGGKVRNTTSSLSRLVSYHALPAWMQDNPAIHTGYRPHMPSWRECMRSGLTTMHNETINIYTHLVGFFFFVGLGLYVGLYITSASPGRGQFAHVQSRMQQLAVHKHHDLADVQDLLRVPRHHGDDLEYSQTCSLIKMGAPDDEEAGPLRGRASYPVDELAMWLRRQPLLQLGELPCALSGDELHAAFERMLRSHRFAMLGMIVSAMVCTLGSTTYHLLWNHSQLIMRVFSRVDYAGIITLVCGHSTMATFYLFYCRPELIVRYNVMLVGISIPTVLLFFHPRFEFPEFRTIRAVLFTTFGVLGGLPLFHAGFMHRWTEDLYPMHLLSLGSSGILYVLGALLFACRYPEIFNPGKYDIYFSSHQWLHIFVLLGAIVHWVGCWYELGWRMEHGCLHSPL
ncbi:Heptahelical transmembrane protein 4 [Porphyridium purpureum]|uniref:Heptahelical transmembrane protein 4 n=1 Tax=Porphyridium purpureum TaxID=35688 RepID=A0A5J4Z8E1_PORPP|nr:Heptahelical transmembrane protein 4 [Porphyridium purpureum]|eukprot:POR1790..scf295_1